MSEFGSPETTRSRVVLYWGSFQAVASSDPEFDWEGEIWETLTHELRHHLESLASDDALEGVDYAMEQEFRRFGGQPFDPFYYRRGDDLGDGLFRVEGRFYLERVDEGGVPVVFEWERERWTVPAPDPLLDVNFLLVVWPEDGDDARPDREPPKRVEELEVVLIRKMSFRERMGRLLRRVRERSVGEWEAAVARVD